MYVLLIRSPLPINLRPPTLLVMLSNVFSFILIWYRASSTGMHNSYFMAGQKKCCWNIPGPDWLSFFPIFILLPSKIKPNIDKFGICGPNWKLSRGPYVVHACSSTKYLSYSPTWTSNNALFSTQNIRNLTMSILYTLAP